MTGTHIGVGLCDRKCSTYFELLNEKKRINRLGEKDYGTHRTETLALINSLASSAGYKDSSLPFPGLSVPSLPRAHLREHFGFNTPAASDVNVEFLSNPAMAGEPINQEDTDSDVDPEEEPINLTEFLDELQDEVEQEAPDANAQPDVVEVAVERIVPTINARETTMKAFERLTNQQAWYPFADSPKSAVDSKRICPVRQNGNAVSS